MLEINMFNADRVADDLDLVCRKRNSFSFYKNTRSMIDDAWRMRRNLKFEDIAGDFCENTYSLGEMEDIALDFYEELDSDLYENIMKVLENEKTTVMKVHKPSEKGGNNSVGLHTIIKGRNGHKKDVHTVEIQLSPKNNTQGLVVIAHEFGHVLEQRIQELKPQKTDCIGEISSMFFERLFVDYLVEKGMMTAEEKTIFEKGRKNSLLNNLILMTEEEEVISRLGDPMTGDNLRMMLVDLCGTGHLENLKHRIDVMINGESGARGKNAHGERVFRYVVGEIVSDALYDHFLKDKEGTLAKVKKFLSKDADYDFSRIEKRKLVGVDECFTDLFGEFYWGQIRDAGRRICKTSKNKN